MRQADLNQRLRRLFVEKDASLLADLLEDVEESRVILTFHAGSASFKAASSGPVSELAQRLQGLRAERGATYQEIADYVGISLSAVIRLFMGQVLPQWPTVHLAVDFLDGDVAAFRADYDRAQADRRKGDR